MTATEMGKCRLGTKWSIARGLGLLVFFSSLILTGCSKSNSIKRLPVFGKVAATDTTEFNGSITFIPNEGTHGPAASTALAHGEYRFSEQNGPTVGPHQVVVKRWIAQPRIPVTGNSQKSETEGVSSGGLKTEWRLSTNLTENVSEPYDFKLSP
jgi:hypothetical protein